MECLIAFYTHINICYLICHLTMLGLDAEEETPLAKKPLSNSRNCVHSRVWHKNYALAIKGGLDKDFLSLYHVCLKVVFSS